MDMTEQFICPECGQTTSKSESCCEKCGFPLPPIDKGITTEPLKDDCDDNEWDVYDYSEIVEWWRKAAKECNAEFQCKLANWYFYKTKPNFAEAIKWYRKAAEQNYVEAQRQLGFCYYNSCGTHQNKNLNEAVKWYTKAAEAGDAQAQYALGYIYYYEYALQDKVEALKWLKKAAEQGYLEAQSQLGFCYLYGFGIRRDAAEAAKWLSIAAERGDEDAQDALDDLEDNEI